jgi:hypothetical protein
MGTSYSAVVDGETFPLTKKLQFLILEKLRDAQGGWVVSGDLKFGKSPEERPDKIIRRIPTKIQRMIKSKTGPGGGFRLSI